MSASSDEQRLARMRRVWRAEAPEAEVVAKAYHRFTRVQPRARHWSFELVVAAAVAGGLLLVFGRGGFLGSSSERAPGDVASSVAAEEVGAGSLEPSLAASTRGLGTQTAPSSVPAGLWLERAGALTPVTPGVQYRVAAGESVGVFVEGERHLVVGPKTFEVALEVDRASGFRLYQSDAAPPLGSASKDSVDGKQPREHEEAPNVASQSNLGPSSWIRAAEAMRKGDAAAAERELQALSRSASTETRDAAELTLAQLWLTHGPRARALPVLTRLSHEGATARIRRRAAELISSVTPSGSTGAFPPP